MPPIRKFQREDIIRVACEITRKEGFGEVNARRIAKELNASVQPIYHNFGSMEELKAAVAEQLYNIYVQYTKRFMGEEMAYRNIGLAYIHFAKEYPNFFKLLFMSESRLTPDNFLRKDEAGETAIRSGQRLTGFEADEQREFHLKVWMLTHGIAVLIATKTVDFSDEKIEELLVGSVNEMLAGYKALHKKDGQKN